MQEFELSSSFGPGFRDREFKVTAGFITSVDDNDCQIVDNDNLLFVTKYTKSKFKV